MLSVRYVAGKWCQAAADSGCDTWHHDKNPMTIETWYVAAVVFLGTLVRSTFGFGDALVAMPLLTFVVSMQEKAENMEIIRTIALLAHNLGMDIVAEGVETEQQMRLLIEAGCTHLQGYLFGRPESAADCATRIALQTLDAASLPPSSRVFAHNTMSRA